MKMLIVDDSRMVTDVIGPMILTQIPELELHTATSYEDAHDFLINTPDLDYLVSDYFLDKGKTAIDLLADSPKCHSILISNKDMSDEAEKHTADFLFKSSGWLDKRIIAWMEEFQE